MFKWDGSELTNFINDDHTIVEEGTYEKNIYWRIERCEQEEYCLVRFCLTTLPCLIDELKPIFHLERNGTHWVKYKGKKLILLKLVVKDGIILQDLTLDKLGYNESVKHEVQKIFIFRELLGLSRNFETSIVLRNIKNFIKPVSFYEPNMNPGTEGKVIPNTILDKWFSDMTLDEGVKKLFSIKTKEEITKLSHNLRNEMNIVVERVDKEMITSIGEILERILARLQYILD